MTLLTVVLLCAAPIAGVAQPLVPLASPDPVVPIVPVVPLDPSAKLHFHAEQVYGPLYLVGTAAYAGILQAMNTPREWGQGGGAYGKRLASSMGASGIHAVIAFGLDSTLHQDPRYFRSLRSGFWPRAGHALHGTILTRTDSGGETLSTWRLGSAYGTAYLSNQWYPARLNTVRQGAIQGSLRIGFDFVSNLGAEFWPDIRRKVLRRN